MTDSRAPRRRPSAWCVDASLRLGAVAIIGAALLPPPVAAAADDLAYTVRSGDTLIGIAHDYLAEPARWPELKRRNRVSHERRLMPGSTLRIPLDWLRQTPARAVVTEVFGEATIDGRTPRAGDMLSEGAHIETGKQGSIALTLADGSSVSVQPQTSMRLERLRTYDKTGAVDSVLRIDRGRLENSVQTQRRPGARFETRTPSAVAAVRGTHYRVADFGGAGLAEVLDGTTEVTGSAAASNPLRIGAGYGVRVDADGIARPPVALLPAPVTDQLPSVQERPLVRFRLPPILGAQRYRAQIATDPLFRIVREDVVFGTPELRFPDLPDGDYRLRVRGIDQSSLEGMDAVHSFRLKARPEPPFPAQPAERGKVRGEQVEFRWSGAAEAATYAFQVAAGDDFDRPVFEASDVTALRLAPERRFTTGSYAWRIASVRADGDRGPWSDVQRFEVHPAPADPEPPALDEDKLAFRWAAEPNQRFLFQMARDSRFSSLVHEARLEGPAVAVPRPEPGTYYMRVQATDPDGFVGPFTVTQRIEVPPPPPPAWLLLLPLLILLL